MRYLFCLSIFDGAATRSKCSGLVLRSVASHQKRSWRAQAAVSCADKHGLPQRTAQGSPGVFRINRVHVVVGKLERRRRQLAEQLGHGNYLPRYLDDLQTAIHRLLAQRAVGRLLGELSALHEDAFRFLHDLAFGELVLY